MKTWKESTESCGMHSPACDPVGTGHIYEGETLVCVMRDPGKTGVVQAAPDALAALKYLVGLDEADVSDIRLAQKLARQVIAKAEGNG